MRIVILTNFLPPTQIGGTEVLSLNMAKSLQAHGVEVEVICADNWATASSHKIVEVRDVYNGLPVRRLSFNWKKAPDVFRYLYNNPLVDGYLRTYLQENQPDIMHVLSCYTLSASPLFTAAELGVPVILTATDFWFVCARNTLLHSEGTLCDGPTNPWKCAGCMLNDSGIFRLSKQLLPAKVVQSVFMTAGRVPALSRQRGLRGKHGDWEGRFDFLSRALLATTKIVTASKLVRNMLIGQGVSADKIVYSSYGIDTSWAKGYETKSSSTTLRIGYIGQIDPHKGLDLLVRAVNTLPEDAAVKLIVYGDLDRNQAYGATIKQLAADNARIVFAGTFPYNEIGRILEDIDVLAVPSVWYDFPLVINSALATKTPVLATDLPGMNEIIQHERNGLLFPRYDWESLARQILRLMNDPDLLPRLAQAIEPLKSIAQMTDEYLALYEAVLSSRDAVIT